MPIPYDDVEFFDHRAAPAGHTARDMALVRRVDALEFSSGVAGGSLAQQLQDQINSNDTDILALQSSTSSATANPAGSF